MPHEDFGTKFSELTALLERVRKAENKTEDLRRFFTSFEQTRNTSDARGPKRSVYPVLRLLVPGCDRKRKACGLNAHTLAQGYLRALGLGRESDEARQLLSNETAAGDLGDRIAQLVRGRCPTQGSLTVSDVNRYLDALNNDAPQTRVEQVLADLLKRGSSADHRWIVRILLKDLRLGVDDRRVLELYHQQAPQLFYDALSDLEQLVRTIESKSVTSYAQPMRHVRPMLCQRIDVRAVGGLLQRGTYWAETKMDGERFQLHKIGPSFRYLSRNGIDYSERFDGTLTPQIAPLLAPTVDMILDGEMMVYDRRELRYRDKCENTDVKSLRPESVDLRPCFCVYDVLRHNGRNVADLPYAERARLLGALIVREQTGFLVRCHRERVRDAEHLVELLNAAIDAGQEGIVLKREDAPYQPNRRGWAKVKPDYVDGLVVDFDLLIVGGFYGQRGQTHVMSVLVGVLDDRRSPIRGPGCRFLSIGKVRTGLSVAQWTELNRTLSPHWRKTERSVQCGQTVPDVWIDPKVSVVLQLRGSELVRSGSYAAGYTLRFSRIVSIRTDRRYDDVCTISEVEALARDSAVVSGALDPARQATKLAKRHVTVADLWGASQQDLAAPAGKRRKSPVAAMGAQRPPTSPPKSRRFDGREFCVMSTAAGLPAVAELERMIQQHGGRAVANPGTKTYAIIAGDRTYKVRLYIQAARWDVVSVKWLLRASIGDGAARHGRPLEPFQPADMLATTEKTRLQLALLYDRYGDSYTRPVTPTSFTRFLKELGSEVGPQCPLPILTDREIIGAERYLLGATRFNSLRPFRGCSARLFSPPCEVHETGEEQKWIATLTRYRAEREMLRFNRYGGRWLRDTDTGPASHLFVAGDSNLLRTATLGAGKEYRTPVKVLPIEWIEETLETNQRLDECFAAGDVITRL